MRSDATALDRVQDEVLTRVSATLRELSGSLAFVVSTAVLDDIQADIGLGPRYAYELLLDLGRPWSIQVPLVEFRGNTGFPSIPAAPADETELTLTPIGALAVEALARRDLALPLGFIEGNLYARGYQPALEAEAVLDAVEQILDRDVSDEDIMMRAGKIFFPTGCSFDGDLAGIWSGRRVLIGLRASATATNDGCITFQHLPPLVGASALASGIESLAQRQSSRLALRDIVVDLVNNEVRCYLDEPYELESSIATLEAVWGVETTMVLGLESPLPDLLRSWVSRQSPDALREGVRSLRALLAP
jgi:hypothetical protein